MDFPALGTGLCYQFFQTVHRSTVFHAALCGEVGHAVHGTEPYDVFNVDIIANQIFLVVVYVDYPHESFAVLSVKIKKTAVLPVFVYVGRIIGRRIVVSEKQYQAFFHLTLQPVASGCICFFVK